MVRVGRISISSLFLLNVLLGILPNSDAFFSTPSSQTPMTTTINTRRSFQDETSDNASFAEQHRREWINRSMTYYSKVMREERRRNLGQVQDYDDPLYQQEFLSLAKKHYFALRKIKDGKPAHAERIYERIIHEIQDEQKEEEHCDHAQLAVTTLLLALHLQRTGASPKRTRSVFLNFFRVVVVEGGEEECACSAKVLQAFALFEMKQGNRLKSLQLVKKAVQLDPVLQPVLKWKQFRDAFARSQQSVQP